MFTIALQLNSSSNIFIMVHIDTERRDQPTPPRTLIYIDGYTTKIFIEIKRLVGSIKLPLVTNENEQFICDGSSTNIEIFSGDFNFDASWSDEDKQEVYEPLKALADYIFSLTNKD